MEEVTYYRIDTDKYGGHIQYDNFETPTNSVYSDRMIGWSMDKYNKCCMEVWGDQGQYFYDDRKPNEVERFLQLYIGKDNIRLCGIIRYENQSNGFPYWQFSYKEV